MAIRTGNGTVVTLRQAITVSELATEPQQRVRDTEHHGSNREDGVPG